MQVEQSGGWALVVIYYIHGGIAVFQMFEACLTMVMETWIYVCGFYTCILSSIINSHIGYVYSSV